MAEELFFRGFLFAGLRSRLSFLAGRDLWAIFGLLHAPPEAPPSSQLAMLGFALCWLYDGTGSFCPAIAHMINNALAFALLTW